MTNNVVLDNITHKDLKVDRRYCAEYGDNIGAVLTFPTEFADVQREYPIVIRRIPESDDFQFIALLGFEKNENLFLDDAGWHASYVPAVQARGPFLIGFQERMKEGIVEKEQVIYVDMDDPRVGEEEGESVFLQYGGNSPYIEHVAGLLKAIYDGTEVSKLMFAGLKEYDLIEPVNMQIKVNEDLVCNLNGFYTVNEDKLKSLDAEALYKLNSSGILKGIYLIVASLSNVKKMIDMKNRQLAKKQQMKTQ